MIIKHQTILYVFLLILVSSFLTFTPKSYAQEALQPQKSCHKDKDCNNHVPRQPGMCIRYKYSYCFQEKCILGFEEIIKTNNWTVNDCKTKVTDLYQIAKCLEDLAITKNDYLICKEMPLNKVLNSTGEVIKTENLDRMTECINFISTKSKNFNACEDLKSNAFDNAGMINYYRNQCLINKSAFEYNIASCSDIDMRYREYCFLNIAEENLDWEVCLKCDTHKNSCLHNVATQSMNKTICNQIDNKSLLNKCLKSFQDTNRRITWSPHVKNTFYNLQCIKDPNLEMCLAQPLQILIKSNSKIYKQGENIDLDIKLINKTDKEIKIYSPHYWGVSEIIIDNSQGLRLNPEMFKAERKSFDKFEVIVSHESKTLVLQNLTWFFCGGAKTFAEISELPPDTYKVHVTLSNPPMYNCSGTKNKFEKTDFSGTLSSNIIIIKVKK